MSAASSLGVRRDERRQVVGEQPGRRARPARRRERTSRPGWPPPARCARRAAAPRGGCRTAPAPPGRRRSRWPAAAARPRWRRAIPRPVTGFRHRGVVHVGQPVRPRSASRPPATPWVPWSRAARGAGRAVSAVLRKVVLVKACAPPRRSAGEHADSTHPAGRARTVHRGPSRAARCCRRRISGHGGGPRHGQASSARRGIVRGTHAGRSSDSWARSDRTAGRRAAVDPLHRRFPGRTGPVLLRSPLRGRSAGRLRSHSPLRGSSGIAPDSLAGRPVAAGVDPVPRGPEGWTSDALTLHLVAAARKRPHIVSACRQWPTLTERSMRPVSRRRRRRSRGRSAGRPRACAARAAVCVAKPSRTQYSYPPIISLTW